MFKYLVSGGKIIHGEHILFPWLAAFPLTVRSFLFTVRSIGLDSKRGSTFDASILSFSNILANAPETVLVWTQNPIEGICPTAKLDYVVLLSTGYLSTWWHQQNPKRIFRINASDKALVPAEFEWEISEWEELRLLGGKL